MSRNQGAVRKPAAARNKPSASKGKKTPAAAAVTLDEDAEEVGAAKASAIPWARRHALTWKFVQYLQDFPTERVKLFSDTVSDAKGEQRRRQVAKDSKIAQYDKIAKFIFEEDDVEAEGYARDAKRYSKSTGQHLQRLKSVYRDHCKSLGQTGSGVPPQDIAPGSQLENQITLIKKTFPWWDELHGFWRELPNYNPCGVSTSNDGSDHAAAAAALYQAGSGHGSDADADADADTDADADADDDHDSAPRGRNETVVPEDFALEEQQELDNDPQADMDDVFSGTTSGCHSRSPSAAPIGDLFARKGQSKSVARARSGSARPDAAGHVASRSSTPVPTPGKLKQKLASLPRGTVPKGRKNMLDGFVEARLADSQSLSKKRGYDHTEKMTKLANDRDTKRTKLESEERRLREARAHEATENEKQRAHALQLKQLDLQIALAAAGRAAVGAGALQLPPPARPIPPAAAATHFRRAPASGFDEAPRGAGLSGLAAQGFGLEDGSLGLGNDPFVIGDVPLDLDRNFTHNAAFF